MPPALSAGGPSFDTPRRREAVAGARSRRARRLLRDVHQATTQFQINEYESRPVQCDCCRQIRVKQLYPFGNGKGGAYVAGEHNPAPKWNPKPRPRMVDHADLQSCEFPPGAVPVLCQSCADDPAMWSPANRMVPPPGDWVPGMPHGAARPPFVAELTADEELVASPTAVVMQIRATGYGNLSYSGHVAVAPRDVGELLDTVPRLAEEVCVLLVKRRAANGKGGSRGLPTLVVRKRPILEFVLGCKFGVVASYVEADGRRGYTFGPPESPVDHLGDPVRLADRADYDQLPAAGAEYVWRPHKAWDAVTVDIARARDQLPDSGPYIGVPTLETGSSAGDGTGTDGPADAGPAAQQVADNGGAAETFSSSMIPGLKLPVDAVKRLKDTLAGGAETVGIVRGPGYDDVDRKPLLSDMSTPFFWSLALPLIFWHPDGHGDPASGSWGAVKKPRNLKEWHEAMVWSADNGYNSHPFAKYVGRNALDKKTAFGQSSYYTKHKFGDNVPDIAELKKESEENLTKLAAGVVLLAGSIPGTGAYWKRERAKLRGMVEYYYRTPDRADSSLPGAFLTISIAEFHHPTLHRLILQYVRKTQGEAAYEALQAGGKAAIAKVLATHGHVVSVWFTGRCENVIRSVVDTICGGIDFGYRRIEFAKSRGAIHLHTLLWIRHGAVLRLRLKQIEGEVQRLMAQWFDLVEDAVRVTAAEVTSVDSALDAMMPSAGEGDSDDDSDDDTCTPAPKTPVPKAVPTDHAAVRFNRAGEPIGASLFVEASRSDDFGGNPPDPELTERQDARLRAYAGRVTVRCQSLSSADSWDTGSEDGAGDVQPLTPSPQRPASVADGAPADVPAPGMRRSWQRPDDLEPAAAEADFRAQLHHDFGTDVLLQYGLSAAHLRGDRPEDWPPPQGSRPADLVNPLERTYVGVPDAEHGDWAAALQDRCMLHGCSGYCLRKCKAPGGMGFDKDCGVWRCRFGFGYNKEPIAKGCKPVMTGIPPSHRAAVEDPAGRAKVVGPRSHPATVQGQSQLVQAVGANADLQAVLTDKIDTVLEYSVKYVTKEGETSQELLDLFKDLIEKADLDDRTSAKSLFNKLMMRAVGRSDVNAQEVDHRNSGGSMSTFSDGLLAASLCADGHVFGRRPAADSDADDGEAVEVSANAIEVYLKAMVAREAVGNERISYAAYVRQKASAAKPWAKRHPYYFTGAKQYFTRPLEGEQNEDAARSWLMMEYPSGFAAVEDLKHGRATYLESLLAWRNGEHVGVSDVSWYLEELLEKADHAPRAADNDGPGGDAASGAEDELGNVGSQRFTGDDGGNDHEDLLAGLAGDGDVDGDGGAGAAVSGPAWAPTDHPWETGLSGNLCADRDFRVDAKSFQDAVAEEKKRGSSGQDGVPGSDPPVDLGEYNPLDPSPNAAQQRILQLAMPTLIKLREARLADPAAKIGALPIGTADCIRILVLGAGGTGKSFAMNSLVWAVDAALNPVAGTVLKVAMTGMAASVVNGATAQSVYSIPSVGANDEQVPQLAGHKLIQAQLRYGTESDCAAAMTEEVSLVGAVPFLVMEAANRQARMGRYMPITLHLGDLCQLPPVATASLNPDDVGRKQATLKDHAAVMGRKLFAHGGGPDAPEYAVVRLTEQMRQDQSEREFTGLLGRCRAGTFVKSDVDLLNKRWYGGMGRDTDNRRAFDEAQAAGETIELYVTHQLAGAANLRALVESGRPTIRVDALNHCPCAKGKSGKGATVGQLPSTQLYQVGARVRISCLLSTTWNITTNALAIIVDIWHHGPLARGEIPDMVLLRLPGYTGPAVVDRTWFRDAAAADAAMPFSTLVPIRAHTGDCYTKHAHLPARTMLPIALAYALLPWGVQGMTIGPGCALRKCMIGIRMDDGGTSHNRFEGMHGHSLLYVMMSRAKRLQDMYLRSTISWALLNCLNKSGYQQRRREEEARFQVKSDALAAKWGFSRGKYEDAVRAVTGWLVEDGRRPSGFEYECPPPVPVAAAAPVPVPVAAVPPPLAALPPASTEDQREYVRSVCAELFGRDTRDLGGHTPGQDCGETTVEAVAAVIGTGLRAAEFAADGLVLGVLRAIRDADNTIMVTHGGDVLQI